MKNAHVGFLNSSMFNNSTVGSSNTIPEHSTHLIAKTDSPGPKVPVPTLASWALIVFFTDNTTDD